MTCARSGVLRPEKAASGILFSIFFLLWIYGVAAAAQRTIHVPVDQPTIQAGINAANPGDTVLVSPGTYTENIDFMGKAITVISSAGPGTTVIDGSKGGPAVTFRTGETQASIISGFTIENGGRGTNPLDTSGIYVMIAAPSILNNIIEHSNCYGIHLYFAAALVQNNEINLTDGPCDGGGSGIYVDVSPFYSPTQPTNLIVGNVIENNVEHGGLGGAAIYIWVADGTVVESNVIRNNSAPGDGGAILSYNTDELVLAGNLISGNSAQGTGGISLLLPDDTEGPYSDLIVNNTFVGNKSLTPQSSASQVWLEGDLTQSFFVNNIVVGNDSSPAFECGQDYNYLSLTPLVIDHNDIYNSQGQAYGGACPDQTGTYGNISADPQFVNSSSGDYHLKASSPAIDAGNNSALQLLENAGVSLTKDLDGNPRVQDATGKGYPIVDMGAYEYAGVQETAPRQLCSLRRHMW